MDKKCSKADIGEYVKEVEITEEEIQSFSGCSERTQRCMTDCPWPFPGAYLSDGN